MLRGEELDPEQEEASGYYAASVRPSPQTVEYNRNFPIEEFDFIITDECHRSIYNEWRQVLEYFDAFLVGLTATPSRQTMAFFGQNLVMEYNHAQAVADDINVPYNVYRIETRITEEGSTIEAGMTVDRRDRRTRKVRWEELEEELPYTPGQLDRDVVAEDQIRTVIQTFRDRVTTEIFPGRGHVPKTIIFAKDDSHADDIVRIVREEFAAGNDFCQKITYRTTGAKPEDLITQFRNSFNPRIVVTVDMIATGTDIKPVEIVFFMRNVRSRNFFEQMKGWRPHNLANRLQPGDTRRHRQGAFRHRGRRGRHRERAWRVLLAGPQAVRALRQAAGPGGHGRPGPGNPVVAGQPPGPFGSSALAPGPAVGRVSRRWRHTEEPGVQSVQGR